MTVSLEQAISFHQSGNLAAAEQLYLSALRLDPSNATGLHLLGTLQLQQGRFAEAIASFDRVLGLKAGNADTYANRGVALCNLQRFKDAVVSFDKALGFKPKAPELLCNRGMALYYLGRLELALASYDQALEAQPQYFDALMARANVLRELKRSDEALKSYERVFALAPERPELHYSIGVVLIDLGRLPEAVASFDRALQMAPDYAEAWNNSGSTLQSLGRLDEALAKFERAITVKPDLALAHHNRGSVLRRLGRLQEALDSHDQALALQPQLAEIWNDRGLALRDLKRFPEAVASFDQALKLQPKHADAFNNRGVALWDMDRIDDAERSFDKAVAIKPDFAAAIYNRGIMIWARKRHLEAALRDLEKVLKISPDYPYARGDVIHLKMYGADWRTFAEDASRIDEEVRAGKPAAVPFVYQAISQSPALQRTCAQTYVEATYPAAVVWTNKIRKPGKIRVGYVCGEFREHATSYLSAGLYEAHDRDRFEVVAFDNGADDDSALRQRLKSAFDKFIPIQLLGTREAAARIASEDIDILVNLNGYYGALRMDVFAHRPSPIQVNFLGFPGTLGATYIDYILADRFVIAADEHAHYAEKVVYLPDSYQVNDSRRVVPQQISNRAAHGLAADAFVFCHFNYSYKLTPDTFARWMRILKQVDGSVLWLLQSGGAYA